MTPRINTSEWLRLSSAARLLGVTRARVAQMVRVGLLPSIEIDGLPYVQRSAVLDRRAADEAGRIPRKRKQTSRE